MQQELKPSAVFAVRLHTECCILLYSTSITDLLVLCGRITRKIIRAFSRFI